MKKFILVGGLIRSKNDNQYNYVKASSLLILYGLKLNDCILTNDDNYKRDVRGLNLDEFIILYPLYKGNYKEVLEKELRLYENLARI